MDVTDIKFGINITEQYESFPVLYAFVKEKANVVSGMIPYDKYSTENVDYILKSFSVTKSEMYQMTITNNDSEIEIKFCKNDKDDYIKFRFTDSFVSIYIFTNKSEHEVNVCYYDLFLKVYEKLKEGYRGCIPIHMVCSLNVDCPPISVNVKIPEDYENVVPLENYPGKTSSQLELLEKILSNEKYLGKIILLEGPPGTGKTYYIRRLVSFLVGKKEFRKQLYYYLGEGVGVINYDQCISKNVLIFEDADFILDGQHNRGKELLKILNLSSGFIDVNSLFVFSSNLPIKEVDDAFKREGRLLARIHFEKFTKIQAKMWLQNKDYDLIKGESIDNGEYTLAQLYSLLLKFNKIDAKYKEKIGFNTNLVEVNDSPCEEEAKSPRPISG